MAGSPRDESVRLADVLATPKLGECGSAAKFVGLQPARLPPQSVCASQNARFPRKGLTHVCALATNVVSPSVH